MRSDRQQTPEERLRIEGRERRVAHISRADHACFACGALNARRRNVDDFLDSSADAADTEFEQQQTVIGERCGAAQTQYRTQVEHCYDTATYTYEAAHLAARSGEAGERTRGDDLTDMFQR